MKVRILILFFIVSLSASAQVAGLKAPSFRSSAWTAGGFVLSSDATGKIIQTKIDTSALAGGTLDATPTSGSTNGVQSGGVYTALQGKAPLASPTFTGTPQAPTPTAGDNSTKIATTAFVQNAIAGVSGGSISGSAGAIPVFTSSSALGSSAIGQVNVGGASSQRLGVNLSGTPGGVIEVATTESIPFLATSRSGTTYAKINSDGSLYSKSLDDGNEQSLVVVGGIITSYTSKVVADANYVITSSDGEIILPPPAANRTIILPAASLMKGHRVIIHNRGTSGQWVLSGSYISSGSGALTEDVTNGSVPVGITVLRSVDVGSGTYKWIKMN